LKILLYSANLSIRLRKLSNILKLYLWKDHHFYGTLVFGFHPLHLPYVENFSAFLGDTENRIFQEVRDSLVSKLIELKEIKGTHLTFDSSNIPVKVKENNLFSL